MAEKWKDVKVRLIRRRYAALLVASLAISVLLRAPYFQHDFTFIDEAWWANGAKVLCDGGQLYQDVALDKNPPIFWFCALLFAAFGVSMNSIHLGVLLLAGLTSVLLFTIGRRFFSPQVGAAAALVHAVASTTYYIPRIIGMNTETLMVALSAAAAGCCLSGVLHRRDCLLFVSGLLACLAFLTKPVAITEAAFFAIFVLVAQPDRFKTRIRSAVLFLCGFMSGAGAFLAFLWHAGISHAWWDQAILYGFRYVGRIGPSDFLLKSARANLSFLLIYAWLFILIWLSRHEKPGKGKPYAFVVFWALSAFAGVVLGRRYYANYFIQVIPPLSLLGAIGMVHLWKFRHHPEFRLLRRACIAAFLCSFLWFHSRTAAYWASLAYPQIHEIPVWSMGRENRLNREVSRQLIRGSGSEDRIFVWGSRAELYFLTGRKMATPWMDFNIGDDYPPRAAEHQTQSKMAGTLATILPRYIVDAQQTARIEGYPAFRALLERHYSLESAIAGTRLFRLRCDGFENGKPPCGTMSDSASWNGNARFEYSPRAYD